MPVLRVGKQRLGVHVGRKGCMLIWPIIWSIMLVINCMSVGFGDTVAVVTGVTGGLGSDDPE